MNTFDWCCTYIFVLVFQYDVLWIPLSVPALPDLYYFIVVLLAIDHIYFLFSGHGVGVALFIKFSSYIFLLLPLMVELLGLNCEVSNISPYSIHMGAPLEVRMYEFTPLEV